MASKKLIKISKQITKIKDGRAVSLLEEIKTDGSITAVLKMITKLKEKGIPYFEIIEGITKLCYTKTISGKNYEVKRSISK